MKKIIFILCYLSHLQAFSQTPPTEIIFDLKKMETTTIGLNDFIESIEYIPLETTEECLIGQGMVFDYNDNYIIVKYNESNSAYLFDRKGNFIRTIGQEGNGPEDFLGIQNVFIDSEFIIIASMEKALYFNFQGQFIKKTPFPINDRKTDTYFNKQFLRMAESYIFRDTSFYVYNIYNQKGDLVKESIKSIPFPLEKNSQWRICYKGKDITPVYTYQNTPHVREYLNDTIYTINSLNQFHPKYILNLGKYKVTPEIQADIEHYEERIRSKAIITDIIELQNKLFFHYFHNWAIHCCYYDKKNNEWYKFKDKNIPNDYDGGIDINFVRSKQKNQFVSTAIYADEFLSAIEKRERKIAGSQAAAHTFKKLSKRIEPEDNPIIMIVKLKQ